MLKNSFGADFYVASYGNFLVTCAAYKLEKASIITLWSFLFSITVFSLDTGRMAG